MHAGFYLGALTVSIGVIGPGHVGGAFLRQLDRAGGTTKPNTYVARASNGGIVLRHYLTEREEFLDDVAATIYHKLGLGLDLVAALWMVKITIGGAWLR